MRRLLPLVRARFKHKETGSPFLHPQFLEKSQNFQKSPLQQKILGCPLACRISWELFLTSNYHPGNGGPLLAPKGQTSVFYKVPPPLPKKEAAGLAGSDSPAPAQSQSQAQEETVSFRDAQGSDKL